MKEVERLYRIGVLAQRAGVSVRTVRFYDLQGLLVSRHRSIAGFRLYEKQDLEKLRQILALKVLGLSLQDIRQILNTEKGDLKGILEKQRAIVASQIQELNRIELAILEAEKSVDKDQKVDWTAIFAVSGAIRKEPKMSTFTLDEEQLRAASTAILYRPGKKPLSPKLRAITGITVLVLFIAGLLIFKQYVGAGIIALAYCLVAIPFLLKSRKWRSNIQARTKRLTSVPYRIQLNDSTMEVEYENSSFQMPFAHLHINNKNPDFYSVMHELGLRIYIPTSSLNEAERGILDHHISNGPIDWTAKISDKT